MVVCSGNGMVWGMARTKRGQLMTSLKFHVEQFGLLQYNEEPLNDL